MDAMQPDTLIALRTLAGLTQSGLAAAFGIHRVTVARWETDKAPIPKWVGLALHGLMTHPNSTDGDDPKHRRRTGRTLGRAESPSNDTASNTPF